jgi:hypothetical protein
MGPSARISASEAIRRVDFRETGSNSADFESIRYAAGGISYERLEEVKPRWSGIKPQKWSDPPGIMQVSAGGGHTLAVKYDGSLWAWGWNNSGQLGDGTTADRHTPVQIGKDKKWASVSASGNHSLAIDTDGGLWTFGDSKTAHDTHEVIKDSTVFVIIVEGDRHSLGIDTNGGLWAWGSNEYGQLGDGTTTDRLEPVQIWTPPNYGDTDGNGVINAADVTMLRRFIASQKTAAEFIATEAPGFNEANAYVRGENYISSADVSLLRHWLAASDKSEVRLGPRRGG